MLRSRRPRQDAAAEDKGRTTCPNIPKATGFAGKKRPFTGAEFLESLRDGREVYIYGERVKDVTTHPAFRNSAASVALLYDALHDKALQGRAHRADRHRLRRLYP